MNIVSIVFGQIVMMFCMMAVGAAAYKAGLITERGSTDLSNITLYLVIPFVVLTSFQIELWGYLWPRRCWVRRGLFT